MSKRLTLEIIKERLKDINPNIEILSTEYINKDKHLICRCIIDNNIWKATWSNLSQNKGCPICATIKSSKKQRLTIEYIKTQIKEVNPNIDIVSTEYINAKTKIKCRCKIDNNEWYVRWNNIMNGTGCPKCYAKNIKGIGHYNWKGGITILCEYLRDKITPWKVDSMKTCNYKCDITGERFNIVHHLYGFDTLLKETLDECKLEVYENISKYTEDELKMLEVVLLRKHYEQPLGVCLTNEIHNEFHKIYGKGGNTIEQYYKYKEYRKNGCV